MHILSHNQCLRHTSFPCFSIWKPASPSFSMVREKYNLHGKWCKWKKQDIHLKINKIIHLQSNFIWMMHINLIHYLYIWSSLHVIKWLRWTFKVWTSFAAQRKWIWSAFHGYVWKSIILFYYVCENVQHIQHIAYNSVSHCSWFHFPMWQMNPIWHTFNLFVALFHWVRLFFSQNIEINKYRNKKHILILNNYSIFVLKIYKNKRKKLAYSSAAVTDCFPSSTINMTIISIYMHMNSTFQGTV